MFLTRTIFKVINANISHSFICWHFNDFQVCFCYTTKEINFLHILASLTTFLNNKQIPFSSKVKYLGLLFDKKINRSKHLQKKNKNYSQPLIFSI
jgi:hypothetical protein